MSMTMSLPEYNHKGHIARASLFIRYIFY